MDKLKVYLDDERTTPDGWVCVFWPDEAIKLLKQGNVTEISLDHDLGDDERGTGYDVVLWIEEQVYRHNFTPPIIKVHSANTSAKIKMDLGINNIYQYFKRSAQNETISPGEGLLKHTVINKKVSDDESRDSSIDDTN